MRRIEDMQIYDSYFLLSAYGADPEVSHLSFYCCHLSDITLLGAVNHC